MKKIVQHVVIIWFVSQTMLVHGQEMPVILKAMYDEQQRSMKELRIDGHEGPFYISYDINDLKTYSFSATSGALLQSSFKPMRTKNTRILVGSYEFNDESLDNNIYTNLQPNEISIPLDDDYDGIRRSLWVTTDAIYRSAAQHFKENQNTLKEKGKELNDLPHRIFAKVKPQQVNQYRNFPTVDKAQYENYVRKLSEYFRDVPEIYSSNVTLSILQGNHYYLNTEGTSSIIPFSNIVLQIRAANDHKIKSNKIFYYSSLEKLPTVEQLTKELENLIAVVTHKKDMAKVEEDYSGPVLFVGQAVGEAMATLLFGRESLMANNNLDVVDRMQHLAGLAGLGGFEGTSSMETKIGKLIGNEGLTVKAKPKIKTFDGVELMGSFEIDDEGVTPPDELVLIEKGVLKTLLNDRSLTKSDQTPNGHASGPGVIEITFEGNQKGEALKQSLLIKAKEEGYNYAYIIKRISFRGMGDVDMYRVDVATGKEELVTDGRPAALQLKNLRKAKASGDKLKAYNFPLNGNKMVSFICPETLLLEDIEILPIRMKEQDEKETVFVEMPKP